MATILEQVDNCEIILHENLQQQTMQVKKEMFLECNMCKENSDNTYTFDWPSYCEHIKKSKHFGNFIYFVNIMCKNNP